MKDIQLLKEILRKRAQQYEDIHGIILLGSYINKVRKPKICYLPPSISLKGKSIIAAYQTLLPNMARKHQKPRDVDIWLLVKGSELVPDIEKIDLLQKTFLTDLVSESMVSADGIGKLKNRYFGPVYKQVEYYTGFFIGENKPWEGGEYTRMVNCDIRDKDINLPPLEVRAFPSSVFHVRPHYLICDDYCDRFPLAFDLSDWLTTDTNWTVIYQTNEAMIWPFISAAPQGSCFKHF